MDLGLQGKRALILGASSGLGRAIAETLAVEGARIAICARGVERLEAAAEAMGALPIACDLSSPGSAGRLVEDVISQLGGVDILVTNTGGPPAGPFETLTDADWHSGFSNLFMSALGAIHRALPGMKERGWGRILLVTSIAAKEPITGLAISNSIRAGLLGLTNSLSREVAPHGITVNALMPGYTKTERLVELVVSEEQLDEQIPAGRLGRPEELAALATFLASERASYVTGQAIACDGGYLRGI